MVWKRRVTDIIFSLHQKISTLHYFHFSRYRILKQSSLLHNQFLCLKYKNSVKNIILVKNCIKYYVSNFLKRFYIYRGKNIRTTPDDSLHITAILFTLFFIRTILQEQKALILAQKIKIFGPVFLAHRILEQYLGQPFSIRTK